MEWSELYGKNHQPRFSDMADFIGGEGKRLWEAFFSFMEEQYDAKPKMTYSCCSGKPGWNVKFQKSGQSFGTLYPEEGGFSVLVVIAYRLEEVMEAIKPKLSEEMRARYESAQDYMKMGRFMMFRIEKEETLLDYQLLISAKLSPRPKK